METSLAVIIAYVITNVIQIGLIYVAIGLLYTFFKWTLSLIKLRRKVLKITPEVAASYSAGTAMTDEQALISLRKREAGRIFSDSSYPPSASENIGLIVAWAIFWPINMIYTLLADVLTEVWNWLATKFVGIYQAISNGILPK